MEIRDGSKGLLVSLGAHAVFFLLLGVAGYQSYQAEKAQEPIYTVNIVGGSPYHGFGTVPAPRSGNGNPPAPQQAAPAQPSAPTAPPAAPVPAPSENSIPDGEVREPAPAAQPSPAENVSNGNGGASQVAAAAGDPQGGSLDGGDPNGGNPDGSTGETPGPAGPDGPGDGTDFDPEAIQPDVSPTFLGGEAPEYPEALRNHGIQGRVRVQMVVGRNGTVESASVVSSSGYGQMDSAALEAAYTYSFEPATKQGIPVRCYATRTFTFGLR